VRQPKLKRKETYPIKEQLGTDSTTVRVRVGDCPQAIREVVPSSASYGI
jgi:hypothetical protein